MGVTATRIGSSPITLDWANFVSQSSVSGPSGRAVAEAWTKLRARFSSGEVGFYDSPIQDLISQAKEAQTLADQVLQKQQITDCLFLGIGGSSLGPLSLLSALTEKSKTGIRFHFMENPDPIDWATTLRTLSPKTTLVCAVTKSGTTFETLAQVLLAMEWLGKDLIRQNLIVITDPEKGDLRAFAKKIEVRTLSIAPSVGGRFSIFSPVGLFPAALAGLSVTDFLLGAKQVRDYVEKAPIEKNCLFILAAEFLRHSEKRKIHVCMPYSSRLKSMGAWFVQLWGESLGKDGKGFTPLAALGATDQHSILQLLRDGPDDKVTLFFTVDQVDDEVKIPRNPLGMTSGFNAFRILEGHSLHELLTVEYRATSKVLTQQRRPHMTFHLDRLDERALGALYFSHCVLTSITGTLWGINPFDQPGVEEGKVYIREALSQEGQLGQIKEEDDENSPVNRLRRNRPQDSNDDSNNFPNS